MRVMELWLVSTCVYGYANTHQEEIRKKEVRLNKEADEYADKQYEATGENKSKSTMLALPHQVVQIYFQGDQYDRHYKVEARRHYHGPRAEEYIQKK